MNNDKKLTLITGNYGKVAEFERLLGVEIDHKKIDLPEIQSTDVREIAKIKAQTAYGQLLTPAFIDDTGLTIEEWGELPGALIKWFLDNVGNDGIIKMLASSASRKARVTTAIGYCDQDGVRVYTGELFGTIADEPRGDNGFGYDAIFIPDGYKTTFAEMTSEEKDNISMRAIAADLLRKDLL
jgi:XTP/dITP diphosphohydrolase